MCHDETCQLLCDVQPTTAHVHQTRKPNNREIKKMIERFLFSFPVAKLGGEVDGLEKVWNGEKKKLNMESIKYLSP